MNSVEAAPMPGVEAINVLLFESFEAGESSVQDHISIGFGVELLGVAHSGPLLGALAEIARPDVLVVHHRNAAIASQVLQDVREHVPGIPLIVVCARAGRSVLSKLHADGAQRVIARDRSAIDLLPAIYDLTLTSAAPAFVSSGDCYAT